MIIIAEVSELTRKIKLPTDRVLSVNGDYQVDGIAFKLPATYEGDFDFSTAAARVHWTGVDKVEHTNLITEVDGNGYPLWVMPSELTQGGHGVIEFAVSFVATDATAAVTKRWISDPVSFRNRRTVNGSNEDEEAEEEKTYDRLASAIAAVRAAQASVDDVAEVLSSLGTLTFHFVDAKADMTDQTKLYVLTTDGYLYYYSTAASDFVPAFEVGGSQEVIDARTDENGTTYANLKTRINTGFTQLKEDLSALLIDNSLTVPIGQGGISYRDGSEGSDTNRCKSTIYVSFTGYALKVIPKAGYKVGTRIYTGTTVSQFTGYIGFKTEAFEINDNTKYYKFVIGRMDDADITPEDLPDDVVTFSNIGTDKTLTGDNKIADAKVTGEAIGNIKTIIESALMSNTKALPFIWEQGTYNVNTGGKNAATNRVRTKYKVSLNSLNYIVMYCPDGWKLGGRRYTQNNEQTYLGTIPQFTGFKLIKHTEFTMYSFFVGKVDDTDITPSDIPDGIKIIPIYLPHWDANAHGNSVATFRTTRNNPLYVRQICDVAETYYEHRSDSTDGVADMQYGVDSATRIDSYTKQIDCSTYVTLCLMGIPYTDTQYYTKTDTPASSLVPNPQYTWSIDPRLYDYYPDDLTGEPNGGARASQLAEWMIDMGWRVPKDKKLLNLEVGDILFYARTNEAGSQLAQPDRFMCINHIAICTDKQKNISGTGLPYTYTLTEVTNVKPCVRKKVVEDGWDTPDVINVNNYNTLVLICRPDLGSI